MNIYNVVTITFKEYSDLKKKLLIMIIASSLLLCACADTSTDSGTSSDVSAAETGTQETDAQTEEKMELTYFIRSPYNNEETQQGGEYTALDEAKSAADDMAQLGYVVFDSEGNLAYNPCPTFSAAKILYHAKINADSMRDDKYKYGDASVNPALDKTEKLVSCDRFVGWTLYDAGFCKNRQPSTKGFTLYTTNPIENLLKNLKFEKITDEAEVKAGDIIFVGNSQKIPVPEYLKDYPKHVFICAGPASRNNFYRYDAGSDKRLQSTQPSAEPLSTSGAEFRFAYRPVD